MGISIFTPAPMPVDDHARSRAAIASPLSRMHDDPRLTALSKVVRARFRARWAAVALIAQDWQQVIASSGGMLGMYRRSTSLSGYVVAAPDEVFCVLDCTLDARFAGNPFVDDRLIRFYAGAAIRDEAGHAIGALRVTDPAPRSAFTPDDALALRQFAAMV